jgi:hypothetical protein
MALHVLAPTPLLNSHPTMRARLRRLLDLLQRLILFLNPVLDTQLVRRTRLAVVIRPIARDAATLAAVFAHKDLAVGDVAGAAVGVGAPDPARRVVAGVAVLEDFKRSRVVLVAAP